MDHLFIRGVEDPSDLCWVVVVVGGGPERFFDFSPRTTLWIKSEPVAFDWSPGPPYIPEKLLKIGSVVFEIFGKKRRNVKFP